MGQTPDDHLKGQKYNELDLDDSMTVLGGASTSQRSSAQRLLEAIEKLLASKLYAGLIPADVLATTDEENSADARITETVTAGETWLVKSFYAANETQASNLRFSHRSAAGKILYQVEVDYVATGVMDHANTVMDYFPFVARENEQLVFDFVSHAENDNLQVDVIGVSL